MMMEYIVLGVKHTIYSDWNLYLFDFPFNYDFIVYRCCYFIENIFGAMQLVLDMCHLTFYLIRNSPYGFKI